MKRIFHAQLIDPNISSIEFDLLEALNQSLASKHRLISDPSHIHRCIAPRKIEKLAVRYPDLCAKMSDPLSKYIDLGQEKGDFSAKIFCEIGIFGEMQNLRVGNDVKDILKAAELIQSRLGTSHPGIRSGSIGTVSDGRGMSYHFPPISEGLKFLDKNKLCFREIAHSFPMIAAIVATSYFLAVHPFRDGNGRTFRIILNILFSVAADAKRYLPVSAVAAASNGGHLIKLKRALYQQEWLPLFQQFEHYYDAVIALAHDWGEKPHKTSQSPAKS